MLKSLKSIKNIFYINLEARTDRREHVEQQLNQLGLHTFERFNAIKTVNGAVGCSLSHIKCLELAKERGYEYVLIVEDDILFLNPALFKNQMNKFLLNKHNWDVVIISGNNVPPYERIDDTCIVVSSCQTTTGYLVSAHYFDTLLANFKEGLKKLLSETGNRFEYALDKYWFKLQRKDNWFLITPLTVVQREDYSDIEKVRTNYMRLMVDIDKPHLRQNIIIDTQMANNTIQTIF
jgi:GR25 family glycosyltransferase involved in LPS biosynthesis